MVDMEQYTVTVGVDDLPEFDANRLWPYKGALLVSDSESKKSGNIFQMMGGDLSLLLDQEETFTGRYFVGIVILQTMQLNLMLLFM